MELFKHFTDVTRGVRRLGAAAVDLCHVAMGITDGYVSYSKESKHLSIFLLQLDLLYR